MVVAKLPLAAATEAAADEASQILALLDAAVALGRSWITLFERDFAEGIARYALTLWCSARNLPIHESLPCEANGYSHVFTVGAPQHVYISLHLEVQLPEVVS